VKDTVIAIAIKTNLSFVLMNSKKQASDTFVTGKYCLKKFSNACGDGPVLF